MNKHNNLVDRTVTSDFEQFREAANNAFCQMSNKPLAGKQAPFHAELVNTRLDRIHLARIATSAVMVERSKQDLAQISGGDASYLVKFQLDGEALVEQCGREAHLRRGDFVVCASSEPYKLHFPSDYKMATLGVPQEVLNTMFKMPEDYLGVKMCGQSPVHGLLSQFISSLVERMDQLDSNTIQRLEANILDLLVTSLHAESREQSAAALSKTENQLDAIKRFIAMNLRDYKLSVDVIASAQGISKRYLHLLFKQEGISVSRYIQQQRLQACHRALMNGDLQHLSTTELALEFGFGDLSHFYRCFKAQFGVTPGQLREQLNGE